MPAKQDYLIFYLVHDQYALPIQQVLEVLDRQEIRCPEGCPPSFLGLTTLRGRDLPVYNLRRKMGCPVKYDATAVSYIVVDTAAVNAYRYIALEVDGVNDVITVNLKHLSDIPGIGASSQTSICEKIIDDGENLIISLDSLKMVDENEWKSLLSTMADED